MIVILLFIAGCLNALMDTIAHHPEQLSGLSGKFGKWVRGEYKIAGDWMIGSLYMFKDGWHFTKQLYIACFMLAILISPTADPFWFWALMYVLSYWAGFLLIYKGVFGD